MTHNKIMNMMLLEGSSHQLIDAVSVAVKERDAAREALAAILMHIDPYEDSLQATIAAFVEQGMGAK